VLEGDAAGLAAKVSQLSADHLETQTEADWVPARRTGDRRLGRLGGSHDAPAPLIHSRDS